MTKEEKKTYYQNYRLNHKEQIKKAKHKHHLKNKEKINNKSQKWRNENKYKILEYYLKNKEKINIQNNTWKKEHPDYNKNWHKKYPWMGFLYHAKQRCINKNNQFYKYYGGRGIKCLITKEEIKKLWFRDKAWLLEQPSIDRKENDGDYTFENCQFIELIDNAIKDKKKSINQFDLQGNFIKTWESMMEIQRTLKFSQGNISMVCSGKRKSSNGFIWKL